MSAHAQVIPPGPVDLTALPTDRTAGVKDSKSAGKQALVDLGPELSDLQERLFAHGRCGSTQRVLLVLQGMDTAGKGGILRHTVGLVDPQGVRITSFKAPTEEERDQVREASSARPIAARSSSSPISGYSLIVSPVAGLTTA